MSGSARSDDAGFDEAPLTGRSGKDIDALVRDVDPDKIFGFAGVAAGFAGAAAGLDGVAPGLDFSTISASPPFGVIAYISVKPN